MNRPLTYALILPILVLAIGSFLRHAPGEWSRDALLTWMALLVAFLAASVVQPQVGAIAATLCMVLAFLAAAAGGAAGLALVAATFIAALIAGALGLVQAPTVLCAAAAIASTAVLLRQLLS